MAIEDFGGKVLGQPVEIVVGDHQNKPDVAAGIARRWFDIENVSAIADLTNSAVALAVQKIANDNGKITLAVGPATTRLTNEDCSPTGFHWAFDTYSQAVGTARAIVGQGGFIYKTTDGGLTWAMLNNGIGGVSFYDLEMFDDNAGLAVGDNGYFLRTANGGTRWDTGRVQVTGVVVGRNESLQAVSVVDANFAVAAGYDGVVYKTFDRGVTWQSIGYPNLPGVFYISDVKFIDHNIGYVTGSRPGIPNSLYKTIDGGTTWTVLSLNAGQAVDFVDVNHGWMINVGGLGYRTTDGGAHWTPLDHVTVGIDQNFDAHSPGAPSSIRALSRSAARATRNATSAATTETFDVMTKCSSRMSIASRVVPGTSLTIMRSLWARRGQMSWARSSRRSA